MTVNASAKQLNQKKSGDFVTTIDNRRPIQEAHRTNDSNEIDMNYDSGSKTMERVLDYEDQAGEEEDESIKHDGGLKDKVNKVVSHVKSMLSDEGFDLMAWGSTDGYNRLIEE